MSKYEYSPGTLFEGFEDSTEWTLGGTAGGALSNSTSIFKSGSKSLKLTSVANGNATATKTISANFATSTGFYIWVYVEDATSLANLFDIRVQISSTTDFSKFFGRTFQQNLHEGWNKVLLGKANFANTGSESWANTMIRLRVRVSTDGSAGPASVYFDSFYKDYYARPKILVTFDDGRDSQYSVAYPIMKARGIKGTCFIISGRVDTATYMTTAQLRELHNEGWDMCNHTLSHIKMDTYNTADSQAEVTSCANFLSGLGFTRRNEHLHVAYPLGGYNADVLVGMANAGMVTARTVLDRNQAHEIDSQYLLTRQFHGYTQSQATYYAFIDKVIADGGSVQINYHKIIPSDGTDTGVEVYTSQFTDMMDYIASKRNVADIVTLTEWYQGLSEGRRIV